MIFIKDLGTMRLISEILIEGPEELGTADDTVEKS